MGMSSASKTDGTGREGGKKIKGGGGVFFWGAGVLRENILLSEEAFKKTEKKVKHPIYIKQQFVRFAV